LSTVARRPEVMSFTWTFGNVVAVVAPACDSPGVAMVFDRAAAPPTARAADATTDAFRKVRRLLSKLFGSPFPSSSNSYFGPPATRYPINASFYLYHIQGRRTSSEFSSSRNLSDLSDGG